MAEIKVITIPYPPLSWPDEYKYIKKKLKETFPDFEIKFWERDYNWTFGFGIRKGNICAYKEYNKGYLRKKRAYKSVYRVIKKWEEYIKGKNI